MTIDPLSQRQFRNFKGQSFLPTQRRFFSQVHYYSSCLADCFHNLGDLRLYFWEWDVKSGVKVCSGSLIDSSVAIRSSSRVLKKLHAFQQEDFLPQFLASFSSAPKVWRRHVSRLGEKLSRTNGMSISERIFDELRHSVR